MSRPSDVDSLGLGNLPLGEIYMARSEYTALLRWAPRSDFVEDLPQEEMELCKKLCEAMNDTVR